MAHPMRIFIPRTRITNVVQTIMHNKTMSHEEKARAATNVIVDELNTAFEPSHHGDPEHPDFINPLPPGKLPHHKLSWRIKQRCLRVWTSLSDWFVGRDIDA